jgi:solute carrier family 8 (sodium/calcium exchanger)
VLAILATMESKANHLRIVLTIFSWAVLGVTANPFATWAESCRLHSGTLLGIDSDEADPYSGKIEDGWPMGLRLILYLLGLGYTFYAVAIISDIFMAGIEKVTSKKVRKEVGGRMVTSYFWNATVANLTLMALGSSAPEIMMGCFEVVLGGYLLGPLGPGVIVGSAAFNLLVISAVCVNAHEDGKVTKIQIVPVYIITAVFSVFAYLWLMLIIMGPWSRDIIEPWEAIATILLFPILTTLAYLADRGKITFGIKYDDDEKEEVGLLEDASKEELAAIEFKIKQEHGDFLTEEQVIGFMKAQYCTRRNKAYYAHAAMQKALVNKKIDTRFSVAGPAIVGEENPNAGVTKASGTADDAEAEKSSRTIKISFHSETYACLESAGTAKLKVVRTGPMNKASVKYKTIEGTAKEEKDFIKNEGVLVFEKDVVELELGIKIMNDNAYEEDENFFVELFEPMYADDADNTANLKAELGEIAKATMTIIDDDLPGKIRFKAEQMNVEEQDNDFVMQVIVERFDGSSGTVACKYETENMGAVAGIDYESASGSVEMDDGVMSFPIPITIKASGRYTNKASFNVILTEPTCTGTEAAKGKVGFAKDTDGGEDSCICHVEITGKSSEMRDKLLSRMASKLQGSKIAHQAYANQFKDAIFKVMDDDDEDEDGDAAGPTKFDYAFHFVGMPWKLLFAFCPPTDYCGGYPTFCIALAFIGLVTILVGDLANLLGCALALPSEITAITFVALGTSLPDTFASKTAAEMDPYADNSIGNVTGSNSVNVFLGCGLAWTFGAIYWMAQGTLNESAETMTMAYNGALFDGTTPRDLWLNDFAAKPDSVKTNVLTSIGCVANEKCTANFAFMVPAGSLWFNLMVFSANAGFALFHLWQRRRMWGGELGGPKKGFMGQYFSGVFLVSQWFIYIIASSIMCLAQQGSFD